MIEYSGPWRRGKDVDGNDAWEPSMMEIRAKWVREERGEKRKRRKGENENQCSKQQTTTNEIHKRNNSQDDKGQQQHIAYIGGASSPEPLRRRWNRYIMTECDGTQQKNKNRSTPKTLRNNKRDIMIILPHVRISTDLTTQGHLISSMMNYPQHNFKFTKSSHLRSDYRQLTPITEPTALSGRPMSSLSHLSRHVVKLSRQTCLWIMLSLDVYCSISDASWPHLQGFPMLPLSFGIACLLHASWDCLSFSLEWPTQSR